VSGRPPHPIFAGSLNSGAILSVPKPVIFGDFVEFCWTPVQDFSQNESVLERSFYSGANFVDFSLSEHALERSFYSNVILAARLDVIFTFSAELRRFCCVRSSSASNFCRFLE
jgi:hypothetical protein